MTQFSGTEIDFTGAALDSIEQVALDRRNSSITADIADVRAALEAGHFNVAVVGQFKRGKSTLINALIGRELLPMDVTPLTSAITIVQHGPKDRCLIKYENGQENTVPLTDIGLYASEDGNPGNNKEIRVVVAETPANILMGGMRLVDTPGIGSIFEPNSETTRSFLPRIDVAIVVLGSDPPITGEELNLIRALKSLTERILIVMNKSDLLPGGIRSRVEMFTRGVLKEQLNIVPEYFQHVSALHALRGQVDNGFGEFIGVLRDLTSSSRIDLARRSAHRSLKHFSEHLLQNIELERRGLIEPINELDGRIARFQVAMQHIDDSMIAAKVRVGQDIPLSGESWTSYREQFISDRAKQLVVSNEGDMNVISCRRSSLRKEIINHTRGLAGIYAGEWQELSRKHFEEYYHRRVELATSETNRIIERVCEATVEAFNISISHFEISAIKAGSKNFHGNYVEPVMALDISGWLIPPMDLIMPRRFIIWHSLRHAQELLTDWLTQHLYQIDEYYTEWLDGATRSLTEAMQMRLDDLRKEILDAVAEGRSERAMGESKVAERLKVLDDQQNLLTESLKHLES